MKKIIPILLTGLLIFSGCQESGTKKNSTTTSSSNQDNNTPLQPILKSKLNKSYSSSTTIELEGEAGSAVLVNNQIVAEFDGNGKAKVNLNLFGKDGVKTFNISVEDMYGNRSEPIVIKLTKDSTPPTITINSNKEIVISKGSNFTPPKYEVLDNLDSNASVVIKNEVNTQKLGKYYITYIAQDSAGNKTIKKLL
jgi:hypothetical protein